jgi:argininosuccinate lyase
MMPKRTAQTSEDEIKRRAAQESFPAPAYAANVLTDVFEDAKRLFLCFMLEVDYAHALMLAEQGIITRDEARALFAALDGLDADGIRAINYDGSCEDLFFYIERLMADGCGEEIAGRLHTARSRNDIDVTIYRMRLRSDSLVCVQAAVKLRRELLDIAEHHHETIIPAYTHTQPAQPTTLAHYMLAMAEVLGRDINRLRRAFENINHCPLGACAITTTGFPIDRERTAQLLGFDSPTVNSYASIGAIDYFTEMMAAISVLMINVGRFAQDFLLMAMQEFDSIKLSDGYVQTSSIMPQKRNPVALEHVRVLASKALGQATGVFISAHNTPFGDINDVEDDLQPLIANTLRDATRSLSLFAAALSTAIFNVETLRRRASEGFITVTELADTLVRKDSLPFRTAHQIVAGCVRLAHQRRVEVSYELLQSIALEMIGRPVNLSPEEVTRALDPQNFVAVRGVAGGPAPAETRRAAALEQEREQEDALWYAERQAAMENYPRRLRAAVDSFMSRAFETGAADETRTATGILNHTD